MYLAPATGGLGTMVADAGILPGADRSPPKYSAPCSHECNASPSSSGRAPNAEA